MINLIWDKHEKYINDYIKKPVVAFTRPKNIKDIIVKARVAPPAIKQKVKNQLAVINRPISTFDKEQIKAPITHTLFKCREHEALFDKFSSLEEVMASEEYHKFYTQHEICGNVNLLPVQVTYNVSLKCTECNFQSHINTTKRTSRIEKELFNLCYATREAKLRIKPIHTPCGCTACDYHSPLTEIKDHRGTNYRLLPFDCKMKHVIYIIHCTLCKLKYVGMTSSNLKTRLSNHLSSINTHKDTAISRHFNSALHNHRDHLRISIIDRTLNNVDLHIREGLWMQTFQTVFFFVI